MPFNLGPLEMLFVMVVLLLVFGAKRLPELGSGLGKGIREFKRTMREMNDIAAAEPQQQIAPQGAWAHVQAPQQLAEPVQPRQEHTQPDA